ncbi:hypothetical protein BST61_g1072 [Cercospora zeina]
MSEKSSSLHDRNSKHHHYETTQHASNNHDVTILESQPSSTHKTTSTNRLLRKIDLRLLPVLASIYSFALIDRVNLPNARIAGMDSDLSLSIGNRYTLITMMFFVPYVIFQFPANIAIRKFGIGFNGHWTQTIGCRILLGVLEAGYFPGCVFLLSCWYLRYEVQKRFSAFYLLALLASGFSNILAYGLSEMKGIGGLNGWRWIFIMEGIITVLLGLLGYLFIVDFPDKSTRPGLIIKKPFLTEEEARIVLERIDRDRGDAVVDKLTTKNVMIYLRDWKIWEYAWLYLLNNTVTYSFGFFLPVILNGDMGYSTTMSQVLSFPPYVFAAPWMFATAWFADRYRKRGIVLIFNCAISIVGVAMMGFVTTNPAARYAGVFLGVAGANSNVPTILSYLHNNIVGQMKRSVASALLIGGGAIGGIVASNIFRQQDAPRYSPAMYAVIATQAVSMLHVLKNFVVYSRKNRKADRGELVLEGQVGFRQTL